MINSKVIFQSIINPDNNFLMKSLGMKGKFHSCLESSLTWAVWIYNILENNFGIMHTMEKYLKESFSTVRDDYFSFIHFPDVAFICEILPIQSGGI